MLDIPNHAVLDKLTLVGNCLRLLLGVDAERLRAEVKSLPPDYWGTSGGRVGVHRGVGALFLRGFAPAEGDKPIEDRPALERLPYVRHIIGTLIPAPPLRCLLARLPAGAVVASHIDRAPYFAKSLRIHVPVETHNQAWMVCNGQTYLMRPGEIWVLNNSATHAVWNGHTSDSRTHLICDFLPTAALLDLMARGDRNLGRKMLDVEEHIAARPAALTTVGG
jgi:aspartyl/asparaginyl beta-hydroxylase